MREGEAMRVRFSVVEEFIAELALEAEQQQIEDRIVWVTYNYAQSRQVSFVYHMSVVAGFVVRGKLIQLTQRCGDVMRGRHGTGPDPDPHTEQTDARAKQIADAIHTAAVEVGLMV